MTTRRELQRQYAQAPRRAGVFTITNRENGRVYLGSSTNLHGPLNKHRFMLSIGSHHNPLMQSDWRELGEQAFTFEIVDSVERRDDDPAFCLEDELSLLEAIWIEKLTPFSGDGYNRDTHIRE